MEYLLLIVACGGMMGMMMWMMMRGGNNSQQSSSQQATSEQPSERDAELQALRTELDELRQSQQFDSEQNTHSERTQ